ncbi:hypothetical protein GCM10022247_26050 [Allokutzneria multivorans]|uniref:Uncharacterized protein n=1 Tax=Allokutzneria multivorans TaxID=1142134 RepID=A0ABP7RY24_9PSEU
MRVPYACQRGRDSSRARPAHYGTRKGPQVKPTPALELPRNTHPTATGIRCHLKPPAVPDLEAQPYPAGKS